MSYSGSLKYESSGLGARVAQSAILLVVPGINRHSLASAKRVAEELHVSQDAAYAAIVRMIGLRLLTAHRAHGRESFNWYSLTPEGEELRAQELARRDGTVAARER